MQRSVRPSPLPLPLHPVQPAGLRPTPDLSVTDLRSVRYPLGSTTVCPLTESEILSSFSCTTVLRPAPMAVRSVVVPPPMGVVRPPCASIAVAVASRAAADASRESGTGVKRSRCFCFLTV